MDIKSNVDRFYKILLERLIKWAETRTDVRAIVIIGSHARIEHPADEWSDLDVLIIADETEVYLTTSDWIKNIGEPLLTFVEPTATEDESERRVLFENMLDADFTIISKKKLGGLLTGEIPPQFGDLVRRGISVLLDKDGMVAQILARLSHVEKPHTYLTQQDFLQVVNDFLYHAVWTAKKLRRGELWTAKQCCDAYMKRLLLIVIEWHARATYGWEYDTWFRGRFLEEWADSRVIEKLRGAFAHYDEQDVKCALMATLDVFHWVAKETAEKLGYTYPEDVEERVREWLKAYLSDEGPF